MNTSFLLVKCEGSTKGDWKKRFSFSFLILNFLYQLRAGSAGFFALNFFKSPCTLLRYGPAGGARKVSVPAGGSLFP
jgi:hypothetical protein